jgi:hypothetical protein
MKPIETPCPQSYLGHVKNGVVVLDSGVCLAEGQAVRVEPIGQTPATALEGDDTGRLRRLQELFAEWTEEDSKLSENDADLLRSALEQNHGLNFRSPHLE